jgi:hypothetical protein
MNICKLTTCITLSLIAVIQTAYTQNITTLQNKQLLDAEQGGIARLENLQLQNPRQLTYQKTVLPGPQFVISDDPEYIRVPEAIALKEQVAPGSVRFYLYNANGVTTPNKMDRKITALITNKGKSNMHIRMLKYSSQPPTNNYFKAGKQGLTDYFNSPGNETVRTLKPGASVAIDDQLEKQITKYDELVHGFYEFVIDQPGEINVIQTDPKSSGTAALKRIKTILPPKSQSGAGRGVYGISNYAIESKELLDTRNGITALTVADGTNDQWVTGKEGTTGQTSILSGNYGILYHINLKWKSSDGKGLALVSWNSRSSDNKWCNGMAASMVVSKGKFVPGVIQLPKKELTTKGAPEVVLIQVFQPSKDGEEQQIQLTYSPPGASCLPTPLVFIPVDILP